MTKEKDPAFLFYPEKFLTGVTFLSDEQVGKYIKLLCYQHQFGGLIDTLQFNMVVGDDVLLKSKFVETEDGFFNVKLMKEIEKRNKKSNNMSKNAKIRWDNYKKKHKKSGLCKSNAIADAKHMLSKDININTNKDINLFKDIINDLNLKTGSSYKHTTKKTKDLIKARINEGFSVEDFKIVHDKKCSEWIGTDMAKYLRPETLYSPKFEGYLNQKEKDNRISDVTRQNLINAEKVLARRKQNAK